MLGLCLQWTVVGVTGEIGRHVYSMEYKLLSAHVIVQHPVFLASLVPVRGHVNSCLAQTITMHVCESSCQIFIKTLRPLQFFSLKGFKVFHVIYFLVF